MHPAPSVIVFTTFAGAGFGLLFWLGLGWPAPTGWAAFGWYALAYALAVGGLSASVAHLGRPERAWRAFSQWRSSWLSREGWAAVAALLVMGLHGLGALMGLRWGGLGLIGAALCLAMAVTTGMIYAQLRAVPRWNQPATPILFVLLSLAGGALIAGQGGAAVALLLLAGAAQLWHWYAGDRRFGSDMGTATGLGARGTVRQVEPPHTGRSYLTDEMVYRIGRKHAVKLRAIAFAAMVVVPLALVPVWMPLAALVHLGGVLVARWLFFAEAEHVVGLYYGREPFRAA